MPRTTMPLDVSVSLQMIFVAILHPYTISFHPLSVKNNWSATKMISSYMWILEDLIHLYKLCSTNQMHAWSIPDLFLFSSSKTNVIMKMFGVFSPSFPPLTVVRLKLEGMAEDALP